MMDGPPLRPDGLPLRLRLIDVRSKEMPSGRGIGSGQPTQKVQRALELHVGPEPHLPYSHAQWRGIRLRYAALRSTDARLCAAPGSLDDSGLGCRPALAEPDPQTARLEASGVKRPSICPRRQPEAGDAGACAGNPMGTIRQQPRQSAGAAEGDEQDDEGHTDGHGFSAPDRTLLRRLAIADVVHAPDTSARVARRRPPLRRWASGTRSTSITTSLSLVCAHEAVQRVRSALPWPAPTS